MLSAAFPEACSSCPEPQQCRLCCVLPHLHLTVFLSWVWGTHGTLPRRGQVYVFAWVRAPCSAPLSVYRTRDPSALFLFSLCEAAGVSQVPPNTPGSLQGAEEAGGECSLLRRGWGEFHRHTCTLAHCANEGTEGNADLAVAIGARGGGELGAGLGAPGFPLESVGGVGGGQQEGHRLLGLQPGSLPLPSVGGRSSGEGCQALNWEVSNQGAVTMFLNTQVWGAGIGELVKLSFVTLASHNRVQVQVLAALLPILLSVNAHGRHQMMCQGCRSYHWHGKHR